jgi:hypothetical protein
LNVEAGVMYGRGILCLNIAQLFLSQFRFLLFGSALCCTTTATTAAATTALRCCVGLFYLRDNILWFLTILFLTRSRGPSVRLLVQDVRHSIVNVVFIVAEVHDDNVDGGTSFT